MTVRKPSATAPVAFAVSDRIVPFFPFPSGDKLSILREMQFPATGVRATAAFVEST